MAEAMLQVEGLVRRFPLGGGLLDRVLRGQPPRLLTAVDGISFQVPRGGTFSLVGESGCGKSTVARCITGLQTPDAGRILFDGQDLTAPPDDARERRRLRRRLQMIFQDPYASLNPRHRVREIIAEPIRVLKVLEGRPAVDARVDELLSLVKLSPRDGEKFPHQFSGGQRQRISIARALASGPEFLVCDEPTSALDVSVQAQVLNLMKDLQRELGLTYLFISHNLAVIAHMSDAVGVMYLGRIVEQAPTRTLFTTPRHPYTKMLLEAVPRLDGFGRTREPPQGEVPNPIAPPSGCHFHPRCPLANDRCRREAPLPARAGDTLVACHAVAEGRA